MDVRVIVTCKGRLRHLRESIPRLLGQEAAFPFKVVVVDYGDPDECFGWCQEDDSGKLAAVRALAETDPFNLSRARNLGARHAGGEVLVFLDADCLVEEGWLAGQAGPLVAGKEAGATRPGWNEPGAGVLAVRRWIFERVNGYDEAMQGWGYEDCDFLKRISVHGPVERVQPPLLSLLQHSNRLRMQFYRDPRPGASKSRNVALAHAPNRQVNPGGFGLGHVELWGL